MEIDITHREWPDEARTMWYMDMDALAQVLNVSKRNLISSYLKNPEHYPYVTRLEISGGKYIVHPNLLEQWLKNKNQK
tara:strand:+ start:85 stop:318 length:234 start_codon:yes stop_codon:yes gene_type:complete